MCRFASVLAVLTRRRIVCPVWSIGKRHSQMHSGLSPCPWARGTDALYYFVSLLLIALFLCILASPHFHLFDLHRGRELALEDGRCDVRRLRRVRGRPGSSRFGVARHRYRQLACRASSPVAVLNFGQPARPVAAYLNRCMPIIRAVRSVTVRNDSRLMQGRTGGCPAVQLDSCS